jgi:hypothetical protein
MRILDEDDVEPHLHLPDRRADLVTFVPDDDDRAMAAAGSCVFERMRDERDAGHPHERLWKAAIRLFAQPRPITCRQYDGLTYGDRTDHVAAILLRRLAG